MISQEMKLVITGGTGFIGSRLAMRARAEGWQTVVTGMTNTEAEAGRLAELKAAGIEVRVGPLQDAGFARNTLQGCRLVIHLAAAQHETNVPDSYFRTVNVDATRTLLEAACDAGVERFVYGSTIGVYGSAADGELDEDSRTQPDNIYDRTKLEAENLVRSYASRTSTTIVRISETYGPGDFRLLKLFKAIDSRLFVMIGSGLNQHQLIHVDDLTRGLLLAAMQPAAVNETFVLAGKERITTREMVAQIAEALGQSSPRKRVPMAPFMMAAVVLERIFPPLGIQPPLHRRRLNFFRKSFLFSTEKARSLLGFEPAVSLEAGARETARWYLSRGYLRQSTSAPSVLQAGGAGADGSADRDVPLAKFAQRGAGRPSWSHSKLLEYTHDAIIIWEMDGAGILYWNRAAEKLYGYEREEVMGRTTHALLKTQIEGGISEFQAKLARFGVWVGELRHTCRDGRQVEVQGRLALMSQHNSRWLVLEVNRDITDLKKAAAAQSAMERQVDALKARVQREPASRS